MELSKIGRYEIVDKLGEGSMGIVYKGLDTAISRTIAIKIFKPQDLLTDEERKPLINRFRFEAQIAGQLSHASIAIIYDVGEYEGIHFIVMEYVEGTTLEEVIVNKKSLSLDEKTNIIIMTARAIHYAHQRGVIHRDIKPANVMLLDDLQIKILDFGIAKLSSKDSMSETTQGLVLGTPYYMSPEHLSGKSLNRQADIFSLGVLSYELLSGEKPFKAESIPVLINKIMNDNPESLSKINPMVPNEIDKIIFKSLEKDTNLRYQTASEYADNLELRLNEEELDSARSIPVLEGYSKIKIVEFLKKNYIFFSDFADAELLEIFEISRKKVYREGEIIFKEGTVGSEMYIIILGEVTITKKVGKDKNSMLASLKVGDVLGEMAIVDSSPRYATATAKTHTVLVAINEVILRNDEPMLCLKLYKNLAAVLSEKLKKKCDEFQNKSKEKNARLKVMKNIDFEKWRNLLRSVSFFEGFSDDELTDIISICEPKKFRPSENIITEEKTCNAMYIIVRGKVEILKKSRSKGELKSVGVLQKDNCFGEAGVLLKKPRHATIRAIENTYLLRVTGDQIERLSVETKEKYFRKLAMDLCVRMREGTEKIVERD